jgi:hypothetical protein
VGAEGYFFFLLLSMWPQFGWSVYTDLPSVCKDQQEKGGNVIAVIINPPVEHTPDDTKGLVIQEVHCGKIKHIWGEV